MWKKVYSLGILERVGPVTVNTTFFSPNVRTSWGGYSYMKVVYMCRPEFENVGLRKRPLTENGELSEQFLTEKRGEFGLKNNKPGYIFEKGCLSERSRSKTWSL